MIVSKNWLRQYVAVDMPLDELTDRLTMSGLNLEGIEQESSDVGIDLEVTSNRPDCLGHLGVCLLYTSPSPRDQRGSRMPSSA